jgi:hypothetical protein
MLSGRCMPHDHVTYHHRHTQWQLARMSKLRVVNDGIHHTTTQPFTAAASHMLTRYPRRPSSNAPKPQTRSTGNVLTPSLYHQHLPIILCPPSPSDDHHLQELLRPSWDTYANAALHCNNVTLHAATSWALPTCARFAQTA